MCRSQPMTSPVHLLPRNQKPRQKGKTPCFPLSHLQLPDNHQENVDLQISPKYEYFFLSPPPLSFLTWATAATWQFITPSITPLRSTSHRKAKEIFGKLKSDHKPHPVVFLILWIKFKVLCTASFDIWCPMASMTSWYCCLYPRTPPATPAIFWFLGCTHILLSHWPARALPFTWSTFFLT